MDGGFISTVSSKFSDAAYQFEGYVEGHKYLFGRPKSPEKPQWERTDIFGQTEALLSQTRGRTEPVALCRSGS